MYESLSERDDRMLWPFAVPACLYVAIEYAIGNSPQYFELANYASMVLLVVIGAGIAARTVPWTAAVLSWFFFALWVAVAGWIVATYWQLVQGYILRAFQIAAIAFSIAAYASSPRRARAVAWVGAICSLYPFVGRLLGISEMARLADVGTKTVEEGGRFTGSVGQPNLLASIMVYGAMTTLLAMTGPGKLRKLFGIGLLSVQLAGIVMSGSRGGLLVFVVLIGASYYLHFIRGIRGKLLPAVLVAMVLVAGTVVATQFVENEYMGRRLTNTFKMLQGTGGTSDSGDERILLAKRAFAMFFSSPIFGIGMDNFRIVGGMGMYPHNNFAVIFTETGLVGAALYFGPIIWAVVLLVRHTSPRRAAAMPDRAYHRQLLAIAIAILSYGMFQGTWRNRMAACSWGLVFGSIIYLRHQLKQAEKRDDQALLDHSLGITSPQTKW